MAVPAVAFESPSSGAVWSGTQTMVASASDDGRVEKVDLMVDGQLRKIDLTVPYSVSVDTRALTNGSHTLQAIAYDIAGNRKSVSRSVTVSNPQ